MQPVISDCLMMCDLHLSHMLSMLFKLTLAYCSQSHQELFCQTEGTGGFNQTLLALSWTSGIVYERQTGRKARCLPD